MGLADKNNDNDFQLTEQQVADFLKENPEFLLRHEDVLSEVQLPHASGDAVSLVERQVSLLRERNLDMRSRLSSLLDNARSNDLLFEKTKQLVLSMLEAKSLDILVNQCESALTKDFSMEFVSLTLFGDDALSNAVSSKVTSMDDAYQAIPGLLKSANATCGVLRPQELHYLFGEEGKNVGSAAVVPLSFGHHLGVLAIGSRDQHYFRSTMGTLFLGYIAEVLNRLLPELIDQAG